MTDLVTGLAEFRKRQSSAYSIPRGLTYRPDSVDERGNGVSYLRDRVIARKDQAAASRLPRHAQEMEVVRDRELAKAARAVNDGMIEYRVNPSLITGQGGEFVPPLWLMEEFAVAPRPGRILSNLSTLFPLPPKCQSVSVPTVTTGTVEFVQGNDNSADTDADIVTSSNTSEVVTISGQEDVALQLLEMSPIGPAIDWVLFKDLTSAYDYQLEQQLVYGRGGTGAQAFLLGITNVTSINAVTYTDAAPTGSKMFPYVGQTAAAVGETRDLPPEIWLMRTARWAWLMSAEDTGLRPFEMPELNGKTALCPGSLLGWPVWLDDAIPATITAGTPNNYSTGAQDVIIACRPSDFLVFEADPVSESFLEVLSGTLGARLRYRNYAAALTARYPSAISVLSGTGMKVASGY